MQEGSTPIARRLVALLVAAAVLALAAAFAWSSGPDVAGAASRGAGPGTHPIQQSETPAPPQGRPDDHGGPGGRDCPEHDGSGSGGGSGSAPESGTSSSGDTSL
jgi:hypothetical protein